MAVTSACCHGSLHVSGDLSPNLQPAAEEPKRMGTLSKVLGDGTRRGAHALKRCQPCQRVVESGTSARQQNRASLALFSVAEFAAFKMQRQQEEHTHSLREIDISSTKMTPGIYLIILAGVITMMVTIIIHRRTRQAQHDTS